MSLDRIVVGQEVALFRQTLPISDKILTDSSPLSSSRQHSEINDCLEDNREDY